MLLVHLIRSTFGSLIKAFAKLTLFFCPEESSPVILFKKSFNLNLFASIQFYYLNFLHYIIFHKQLNFV